MKVSPAHLEEIRVKIGLTGLNNEDVRGFYRRREIPRGDLVQDIDKRFRWDLYWAAARQHGSMPDSTNGYSDAHIDTALRAVVKPLGEGS